MKLLRALTSCTVVGSLLLALSLSARAQAPARPAGAVSLAHQGVEGVWMPTEMARAVQADVEELRAHKELLTARLEARIEIGDERVRNMTEILDLLRQERDHAVGVLEAAIAGQRAAEEARDAWFRAPELWVVVGVVSGVALVLLAAELIPDQRGMIE